MFGGNEEVQQAVQCVAVVTLLDGTEQLAEDDGRRSLEGGEQSRQGALDGRVQRFWVLESREVQVRRLEFM